jgi:hypothetical protein
MLNITFESVSILTFALIAVIYGAYISINQIRKGLKYKFYIFSSFTWCIDIVATLLMGIGYLILNIDIYLLGMKVILLTLVFIYFKASVLHRESYEPVKLIIFSFFATTMIFFPSSSFGTIGRYPNGDMTFLFSTEHMLIFYICFELSMGYYTTIVYKIHKNAPLEIKHYSRIYFLGTAILSFVLVIFSLSGLYLLIPGLLMGITIPIGKFFMVYAYGKEPKLIFVLPFKAIRLTVIQAESGIPLYNYTWSESTSLVDEDLFSGMLQGVSMIMRESINKGEVQEIRLSNAVLLIRRDEDHPIACVLIASKPSKTLNDCLDAFANRFCEKFSKFFLSPSVVSQFNDATLIINECFPHIPKYI